MREGGVQYIGGRRESEAGRKCVCVCVCVVWCGEREGGREGECVCPYNSNIRINLSLLFGNSKKSFLHIILKFHYTR